MTDNIVVDAEESKEIPPAASMNDALAYLISYKVRNFYARVLNSLEKVPTYGIPTLGVAPKRGRYVLFYNPECVKMLSYEELLVAVEHEILHIILAHVPRYLRIKKLLIELYSKALFEITYNLSMDLATNELLRQNWDKMGPDGEGFLGALIYPERWEPSLPHELDYESYQKILLEDLSQNLKIPPSKLYELAKKILEQQDKQTGGLPNQDQSEGQDGDQEGAGKGEKKPQEASGSGEGQGTEKEQEPQQGGGSGATEDEINEELDKLNPVDRKILDLFLKSQESHRLWNQDGDETDAHKLEGHGRQIIKSAADAHQKCRGTLPAHLEEMIRQMLLPPTTPWTQFLHDVVLRTQQTRKERGMARPSKVLSALVKQAQRWEAQNEETERTATIKRIACLRRIPVFPGIRQERKFTILYAIDTSGSMCEDELIKCISELQHIQKSDPEIQIMVIYADADINVIYDIGPYDEIDYNMGGRGGTDFEPVFKKTLELLGHIDKAPDILVYATDGCAPPPTTVLPIPCVWLITPGNQPPCRDAGHIVLEMKDYQLGESYL